MNADRLVIEVQESDFGIRRAQKEAAIAKKRGRQVVFNLNRIQDFETKLEVMKYLSGIEHS